MAAPAESNFQIRVSLMDSEPLIWRRVRLSGETTLEELHRVIQVVMDWENYHMHRFVASDRVYGVDEDFIPDPQSERSVTLREVIPQPQDHLLYEYDFGDGWEHEILVEELLAPEEGVRYRVCVEGEYAAPPEDCGGIPGYYMMLEAIEDEENPDHEEMLEWIGGDFDRSRSTWTGSTGGWNLSAKTQAKLIGTAGCSLTAARRTQCQSAPRGIRLRGRRRCRK